MNARVVAAARRHLGTPFHHQGRLPGVGLDCIGLLVAVARELDLPHSDDATYGRRPRPAQLLAGMEHNLVRRLGCDLAPGSVVVMGARRADLPQHVGILTEHPAGGLGLIHTDAHVGRVTEHAFDAAARERVHSVWAFREERA